MRGFSSTILFLVWSATAPAQTTNLVLSLDGNSYATIQNSATVQNDSQITVEAWINPIASGSVLNKGDGQTGNSQRSYELKWSSGTIRFAVYFALPVGDGQPTFAEVEAPLESGSWTHVAGVYDVATGLKLYTNGVIANALTTYSGGSFFGLKLRQTTLPLVLGSTPPFANTLFNGSIDEVRIWASARTQNEVQSNRFTRLRGNEAALLGYWNFDSGVISDLSYFNRDATSTGNPLVIPITGLDEIHRFMRLQAASPINGRFNAQLQSIPLIPMTVEVSSDLIIWEPFFSLTTPGDLDFTDAPVTNFSRRFFRTMSP